MSERIRGSYDDALYKSTYTSSCRNSAAEKSVTLDDNIKKTINTLNSILYGTSLKHTARLQRIQHAAARVVLYQHSSTSPLSSNELLKRHWLPI